MNQNNKWHFSENKKQNITFYGGWITSAVGLMTIYSPYIEKAISDITVQNTVGVSLFAIWIWSCIASTFMNDENWEYKKHIKERLPWGKKGK